VPAIAEFAILAGSVPLQAPWTTPNAEELDLQTVRSWVEARTDTDAARDVFQLALVGIPPEASLLFALFGIAAGNNFQGIGNAQQTRIRGGGQAVALRVAERLGPAVRLGTPVRRIAQNARGVTLVSDRATVLARRVIVAIPPALCAGIAYDPPMPSERAQLTQRFPQAAAFKFIFVYPTPFWRASGLSGFSLAVDSAAEATADAGFPDGEGRPGALAGFAYDNKARELARLSLSERRARIQSALVGRFGAGAAGAIDYFEHYWAEEEWTRGCFTGFASPGALTGFTDAFRRPVGRIHWAGTETSPQWIGYIDGAVRSGERAAAEVRTAEGF
jgi:monoamine oxidase